MKKKKEERNEKRKRKNNEDVEEKVKGIMGMVDTGTAGGRMC